MSDAADNPPTAADQEPTVATTADQGEAPSRTRALMRHPRRLIIAAILILIAVLVVVFTTATFTSSSANAGNLVAAGTLQINNSLDNAAILTVQNLVPGQSGSGTVQITNVGSAAGTFTLTTSNIVDTPVSPSFSARLDLVITDTANPGTPVYSGKLNAVGTVQLGKWNAGETHKYQFVTTFPQGTPAQDDPLQNAKTTLNFVWNAVS